MFGFALLAIQFFLVGCDEAPPASISPNSVSAWWWRMEDPPQPMPAGFEYDRLYVDAGAIFANTKLKRWPLPETLPAAGAFVPVFRVESAHTPSSDVIPALIEACQTQAEALKRQSESPVWGIQIDFDCPTARLDEYAAWLSKVRQALPRGYRLSITGLLTWYRDNAVRDILAQVDEHTPQFYDLSSKSPDIAAAVALEVWGPLLNSFHVPYRLGAATFGRISTVEQQEGKPARFSINAMAPRLFASPRTRLGSETTLPSGERRVAFTFDGKAHDLIIPTVEVFTMARTACQDMGGWCDGVVLFRHPGRGETLVLSPQEIQAAFSSNATKANTWRLETQDGGCTSLHCTDVYLSPPDRFAGAAQAVTLILSAPLAYTMPLIPKMPLPVAAADPKKLRVTVPPYLGLMRIPALRMFHRDAELTVTLESPSPAQGDKP